MSELKNSLEIEELSYEEFLSLKVAYLTNMDATVHAFESIERCISMRSVKFRDID